MHNIVFISVVSNLSYLFPKACPFRATVGAEMQYANSPPNVLSIYFFILSVVLFMFTKVCLYCCNIIALATMSWKRVGTLNDLHKHLVRLCHRSSPYASFE